MASNDDVYHGYLIPAGTTVIGNTWCACTRVTDAFFAYLDLMCRAILHDEATFPEPWKFSPERFLAAENQLNTKTLDPSLVAFGYGRRWGPTSFLLKIYSTHGSSICPGRFVACSQLWISIASILAAYTIGPAIDGQGRKVRVQPTFTTGMIW